MVRKRWVQDTSDNSQINQAMIETDEAKPAELHRRGGEAACEDLNRNLSDEASGGTPMRGFLKGTLEMEAQVCPTTRLGRERALYH